MMSTRMFIMLILFTGFLEAVDGARRRRGRRCRRGDDGAGRGSNCQEPTDVPSDETSTEYGIIQSDQTEELEMAHSSQTTSCQEDQELHGDVRGLCPTSHDVYSSDSEILLTFTSIEEIPFVYPSTSESLLVYPSTIEIPREYQSTGAIQSSSGSYTNTKAAGIRHESPSLSLESDVKVTSTAQSPSGSSSDSYSTTPQHNIKEEKTASTTDSIQISQHEDDKSSTSDIPVHAQSTQSTHAMRLVQSSVKLQFHSLHSSTTLTPDVSTGNQIAPPSSSHTSKINDKRSAFDPSPVADEGIMSTTIRPAPSSASSYDIEQMSNYISKTISSSTTPAESSTSCVRLCACTKHVQLNSDKIVKIQDQISESLTVDRKSVSRLIRTKVSATDARTSSSCFGFFGLGIMCAILACIILSDIRTVFYQIHHRLTDTRIING